MPDNATVAGEFVALLVTVTLPLTLPAAAGANAISSATDWLGVRAVPAVTPLALNPAPVTVTLDIVTFEFPLFVSVTLAEPLLPTLMLPKFRLAGLAPSRRVSVTPVPLRLTVTGVLEALLVIVRLPDALPAEVGENAIVAVVCWPGLMVRGTETPLMLNPGPVMAACVTVSAAVPVFDTMIA